MSVERVTVARVRCGHDAEADGCPSVLHVDVELDDEQVRAAARERGWEADEERDRCPRHRGAAGPEVDGG